MIEFYFLLFSILTVFLIAEFYLFIAVKKSAFFEFEKWKDDLHTRSYGPLQRSDAIAILHDRVFGLKTVQLLQKLTVFGPLLGVIATGTGFILLEEGFALGGIESLQKVFPIFYGVLLGALLSILNQVVVVLSDNRLNTEMDKFIQSTDPILFHRSDRGVDSIAEAAVDATNELAKSTDNLIVQTKTLEKFNKEIMDKSEVAITKICESCEKASDSLNATDVVKHLLEFNSLMLEFKEAIRENTEVVEIRLQDEFELARKQSESYIKRVEDSTSMFEGFFIKQAETIAAAFKPLEEAVTQLASFTNNALAYSKSLETGTEDVKKQTKAVQELQSVSFRLNKVVGRLEQESMTPLANSLQRLDGITSSFKETIVETNSLIKDLSKKVTETEGGVSKMQKYVLNSESSLSKVQQTVDKFNNSLDEFTKLIEQFKQSLP